MDTRGNPAFPANAVYFGAGWNALNVDGYADQASYWRHFFSSSFQRSQVLTDFVSGIFRAFALVPDYLVTAEQDVAVNLGTPKGDRAAGISASRSYRAVVRSFGRSFV